MYKVIEAFTDLKDGCHVYHSGDVYPRKGAFVTDDRIAELAGDSNRMGYPLIAEVHALNPGSEYAQESYEEAPSLAPDSLGGVHPSEATEAKETPKKTQRRASKKSIEEGLTPRKE